MENINTATTSIRRAIIDQVVVPEDFVEGPLKVWTTDFKNHVRSSAAVFNQIDLIRGEDTDKFVNLKPHLDNVLDACNRKLTHITPDDIS